MANGTISAGKNIQFLLGTQANLEKYISGSSTAAEGTFYLTNDTHRLYVGTSLGTAVPVNEGVITVLNIDYFNRISTTDTRLIRRIVRDYNFRGYSATHTLEMWPSVNRGEVNNIFKFQEEADCMFNSSLI